MIREQLDDRLKQLLAEVSPADMLAARARRSLLGFTQHTFPAYQATWYHRHLCETLDRWAFGDLDRLIVELPPRYGKSELVSRRLPAYILGRNPDANVIAATYSGDLAKQMSRDVKRIIGGDAYKQVFPGVRTAFRSEDAANEVLFWEIPKYRGSYRGAGIRGGVTGMGCTHLIVDDPIKNRQEATSPTTRESIWQEYTNSFLTRFEGRIKVVLMHTRWHKDDLIGRVLSQEGDDWHRVCLRSLREDDENDVDPREVGAALWPAKFDADSLAKMRATIGERAFTSLYQQRPTVEGGALFRSSWFQYWADLPTFDLMIIVCDASFKDLETSSYVVVQAWGMRGADLYLVDQHRERMNLRASINAIRHMGVRWPQAYDICVEDKANGPAIIETLRRELAGVVALQASESKVARAQAASVAFETGNVWLPDVKRAPWVGEYVRELVDFPRGRHDDQVDGTSHAVNRLLKRQRDSLDWV